MDLAMQGFVRGGYPNSEPGFDNYQRAVGLPATYYPTRREKAQTY